MSTTRIARTVIGALVLGLMTAGTASAAAPAPPSAEAAPERPLTPEERAAADRRLAASDAYLATVELNGADLASLSCVTPTGETTAAPAPPCGVPQGYLSVEARDQSRGHYCGPAVGQVISNYTWAVTRGANKHTQDRIAGWMGTNANGGTSAPLLEDGLEHSTQGSPRRPAGWDWVVLDVRDRDRDGHTGDELQGYVRSNVSASKMPLAIPVKPHDPGSGFYLVSWPRPVVSVGHWIAAYGWYGHYTGTTFARVYYTDSSRDEGWDPTRDIAALIAEHTRRIVW